MKVLLLLILAILLIPVGSFAEAPTPKDAPIKKSAPKEEPAKVVTEAAQEAPDQYPLQNWEEPLPPYTLISPLEKYPDDKTCSALLQDTTDDMTGERKVRSKLSFGGKTIRVQVSLDYNKGESTPDLLWFIALTPGCVDGGDMLIKMSDGEVRKYSSASSFNCDGITLYNLGLKGEEFESEEVFRKDFRKTVAPYINEAYSQKLRDEKTAPTKAIMKNKIQSVIQFEELARLSAEKIRVSTRKSYEEVTLSKKDSENLKDTFACLHKIVYGK